MNFYKAKGCEACTNGFKGRIGIYEVLVMNDTIEELVVKKHQLRDRKSGRLARNGDDGARWFTKALLGLTTLEEVLRVINVE